MKTISSDDRDQFLEDTEQYRSELLAYCYKLLGSLHEAEDVVQETCLRAWRSQDTFEGRSSLRTWLYRIATNQCLNALGSPQRRALPSGLFAPSQDPGAMMAPAQGERSWLDPFPGPAAHEGDPAEVVAARSSLRLALVASLQHLPPRQRAVLILREALGYRAAEVAEMLETSVAAVKSALQRARATLSEVAPTTEEVVEPDSPEARAILDRYMDAFERADVEAMNDLLRSDARLELVPSDVWFQGKTTCVGQLRARAMTQPGLYKMLPTIANGQPAAAAYYRKTVDDEFRPFAISVLTVDRSNIIAITVFADPALLARFGFPAEPAAVDAGQVPGRAGDAGAE
ncbi:RNA polymerase ECF family sigma subunit [Kribbella voronezhensis]|uniref:RNA polymerase sigma factor n=1 Tax=Kribbella voronezhensis TaxID=2512212 RepID=A0A4V3FJW1_9ACTN|nr:sigma-70 family RNA polymerase sigma factor [Kribbella voronezhensis]TDU87843.1 RNA polymerase ECF family sigma subunit [Kribbella voronezhensis]